jgi:hypothetical protein
VFGAAMRISRECPHVRKSFVDAGGRSLYGILQFVSEVLIGLD